MQQHSEHDDSIILSKQELTELFLAKRICEIKFGWVFDDKFVDILALHPTDIRYVEHIHKADHYKIVFKN